MSEFSVSLAKLAEEATLTIAYPPCELDKIQVTATEVYRPGILLAGYYENFDSKRIQIIGLTEMSYLDELSTSLRNTHLEKLFSFQPPAIVLTVQNLSIVKVDAENNLIAIKGAIPGPKGSVVTIHDSVKA